ncbi:MAG TPA: serine hydrolase domain-containing protein [Tahibacter sp.]|uniref:serine hydrolase domain-containing protein n=1 Tax=Tahibacter sp. TaxID=2056211 RepID=UPI002C26C3A3|nr:serine hydrolase domain-containing protein [Tahibacter sp.]HSX62746.1 serine hydrolase domain-containing protein [Tahibacter sp.]
MRAVFVRSAVVLLVLVLSPVAGVADYKPVRCDARADYAGRPLHAPVRVDRGPGAIVDAAFDEATVQRLDAAFATLSQATAAPAISAAVAVPGRGLWTRRLGEAPLLYWASAGKAFTAVVVLQLAAEGRLDLDAPVSRWIDDVPNGDAVTVRDLLAHTSGLFSANEDLKARASPRYRSAQENLAIARRHGAMFCAGANWRYSNTGYDLLGAIVERVDGRPLAAAIEARIVARLALERTRVLRADSDVRDIAPLASAKETPIDPRWPGAAGPIAADAVDMTRFLAALFDGRLVPAASVDAMSATLYPMFDAGLYYGLGLMVFDVPDGGGRQLWIGHAGGTPGAGALMIYAPQDRAFVAVALTGDGSAAASVNLLVKALRGAVTDRSP